MKMRAAIAAVCLASGALAVGAAAAQAVPHGPAGDPNAACEKWAKTHVFVWIGKAAYTQKAGLTVTGDLVKVHCGGPDDLQYIVTNKAFAGHLQHTATINVLTVGNGIAFPRLAQAKFPHWVATDHSGSIYQVTGKFTAIRALTEQFHP